MTWTHVTSRQPLSQNEKIDLSINRKIDGLPKFEIQKRVSSDGDRITYMLIIRSLRQDDAGQYKCAIEIHGEKSQDWPSKIGELTVQGMYKIIIYTFTLLVKSLMMFWLHKAQLAQFTKVVKMMNHTGLWDTKLAWYSSSITC